MRLLLIASAFLVTGCDAQSQTGSNVPTEEPEVEAASILDAQGYASALSEAGLPVQEIVIVTEETDANKMLGRPGGYTSKVFFVDGRHKGEGLDPTEQNTIEVFGDESGAVKRKEYVERVTEDLPMLQQYIIQSGRGVLRLDRALTPSEAREYEAAMVDF